MFFQHAIIADAFAFILFAKLKELRKLSVSSRKIWIIFSDNRLWEVVIKFLLHSKKVDIGVLGERITKERIKSLREFYFVSLDSATFSASKFLYFEIITVNRNLFIEISLNLAALDRKTCIGNFPRNLIINPFFLL